MSARLGSSTQLRVPSYVVDELTVEFGASAGDDGSTPRSIEAGALVARVRGGRVGTAALHVDVVADVSVDEQLTGLEPSVASNDVAAGDLLPVYAVDDSAAAPPPSGPFGARALPSTPAADVVFGRRFTRRRRLVAVLAAASVVGTAAVMKTPSHAMHADPVPTADSPKHVILDDATQTAVLPTASPFLDAACRYLVEIGANAFGVDRDSYARVVTAVSATENASYTDVVHLQLADALASFDDSGAKTDPTRPQSTLRDALGQADATPCSWRDVSSRPPETSPAPVPD
jgi:hypothetical protein